MSDDEVQERNGQLADWTVRIDQANSLMIDGNRLAAYEAMTDIRNEIQAAAQIVQPTRQENPCQAKHPTVTQPSR